MSCLLRLWARSYSSGVGNAPLTLLLQLTLKIRLVRQRECFLSGRRLISGDFFLPVNAIVDDTHGTGETRVEKSERRRMIKMNYPINEDVNERWRPFDEWIMWMIIIRIKQWKRLRKDKRGVSGWLMTRPRGAAAPGGGPQSGVDQHQHLPSTKDLITLLPPRAPDSSLFPPGDRFNRDAPRWLIQWFME